MRRTPKRVGILVAGLVIAISAVSYVRPGNVGQFADPGHSIQAQPGISSALAAVLDRSCGDCHSNTMISSWYTRIPPFSVLMARGANEGRKAINFANWNGYTPAQRQAFLVASCVDAKRGSMPMEAYLRFRREARLNAQDVETICSAARPLGPSTETRAAVRTEKQP
jgi:hypothetical protein